MFEVGDVLKNESVKKNIVDPLKKKTYPYLVSGIFFNVLMFGLVVAMTHKVFAINRKLSALLE
jgi:hypothetical protein